jgi:ubiquinone biosynthesis protein
MEYVDGTKVHDLHIADKRRMKKIMSKALTALLHQSFEDGFFHADLHPGNVLVCKGDTIAFLDFGIVGQFTERMRTSSLKLFLALMQNKTSDVVQALLDLSDTSDAIDIDTFTDRIDEVLNQWHGVDMSHYHLTHLLHRILDVCYEHSVHLPRDLVLFTKALITLEGTVLEYYPEFDLVSASQPYVKTLLKKKYAPKRLLRDYLKASAYSIDASLEVPVKLNRLMDRVRTGALRLDIKDTDIHKLGTELDKSSNRLSFSLIIAALIVAAALISRMPIGPFWFGLPALSVIFIFLAFFLGFMLLESIRNEKRFERELQRR